MKTAQDQLVAQIEAAWPVQGPFTAEEVAAHACPECDDLRRALSGLTTAHLSDALIEANFDQLPLMTPEVFRAVLGRYMVCAITTDHESGNVLAFTTYSLVRARDDDDSWWETRLGPVTQAQACAIHAFLVQAFEQDEYLAEQPERTTALAYWSTRCQAARPMAGSAGR